MGYWRWELEMCSRTAETPVGSARYFGYMAMILEHGIFGVYYDTLGSRMRPRGKLLDNERGSGYSGDVQYWRNKSQLEERINQPRALIRYNWNA